MPRKVAFGCDHAAIGAREDVMAFIREAGSDFEPVYMGPADASSVDYPDYAEKVCHAVVNGEAEKGILLCGTGIGMSIAANKHCGIRAGLCHDHLTAQLTRQHNDANVLCAGERISGREVIRDMIITFLNTEFSHNERHQNRINKVMALEKHH